MIRIRRLAVVATATTLAITGGAVVFAFMLLAVVLSLVGAGTAMVMPFGGALAVILAPLLYAAFVWILVALFCVAYNAAASFTGGLGFTVEREAVPADRLAGDRTDTPGSGGGV